MVPQLKNIWLFKEKKLLGDTFIIHHFRDFFWLSIGVGFYSLVVFLVNLYTAKILGPKIFGIWNFISLFVIYGSFLHLGVINGLGREIPYYIGKNRYDLVEKVKVISFYFVVFISICFFCIVNITCIFYNKSIEIKNYLFLISILFFSKEIQDYVRIYLRSNLNFKKMGQQYLISSLLLGVLVYFFVQKMGLQGFILAQFLAFIISSFLFFEPPKFDIRILKYDKEIFLSLLNVGFPIMMAGYLYNLLTSIDRLIVVKYLGITSLGQYSLVIIALGVISFFPSIISNLVYPRMVKNFGENNNVTVLKKYIKAQVLWGWIFILPIFIFFYFVFPLFVKKFMPLYIEGIIPLKIVLLGTLFLPLAAGFGDFLNTIGKQIYYLITQIICLLTNLVLTFIFVNIFKLDLKGAAIGTAFAYCIYGLLLFYISLHYVLKKC
jgi:O-antigen/teichoic acid export membrane protein